MAIWSSAPVAAAARFRAHAGAVAPGVRQRRRRRPRLVQPVDRLRTAPRTDKIPARTRPRRSQTDRCRGRGKTNPGSPPILSVIATFSVWLLRARGPLMRERRGRDLLVVDFARRDAVGRVPRPDRRASVGSRRVPPGQDHLRAQTVALATGATPPGDRARPRNRCCSSLRFRRPARSRPRRVELRRALIRQRMTLTSSCWL